MPRQRCPTLKMHTRQAPRSANGPTVWEVEKTPSSHRAVPTSIGIASPSSASSFQFSRCANTIVPPADMVDRPNLESIPPTSPFCTSHAYSSRMLKMKRGVSVYMGTFARRVSTIKPQPPDGRSPSVPNTSMMSKSKILRRQDRVSSGDLWLVCHCGRQTRRAEGRGRDGTYAKKYRTPSLTSRIMYRLGCHRFVAPYI